MSLWHDNRSFLCMEATYHVITTHWKAQNVPGRGHFTWIEVYCYGRDLGASIASFHYYHYLEGSGQMRVLHSDLITAGRLRLQPGPGGEENTGEVPGLRAKPALRLCGERSAVTPVSYPPVSLCKKHNLLSLSLSLWSDQIERNGKFDFGQFLCNIIIVSYISATGWVTSR